MPHRAYGAHVFPLRMEEEGENPPGGTCSGNCTITRALAACGACGASSLILSQASCVAVSTGRKLIRFFMVSPASLAGVEGTLGKPKRLPLLQEHAGSWPHLASGRAPASNTVRRSGILVSAIGATRRSKSGGCVATSGGPADSVDVT